MHQSPHRYYYHDSKGSFASSISKCVAAEACDEASGAEEPSPAASVAKAAADALLQLDASLDEYNVFDDFDPLAFDAGEILCWCW